MDICLSAARAAANRRNGAKSCGPKTPEGKARSAKNALKHGLRAEKFVLLHDEDAGAFEAMADALADDLAPVGALQALLARRLVVAAWRLERADRIERELFALQAERSERGWGRLGLALVRDGNGPGAFGTLLRYRGSAMAELWRALRALKALQAETADEVCEMREVPEEVCAGADLLPAPPQDAQPIEPEARGNPGEIAPAPAADEPQDVADLPDAERLSPEAAPSEPARPGPADHVPPAHACERTPTATQPCATVAQKCVTMAQKCATYAPPSACRA